MKRSDILPMPAFFDRYIYLADDMELMEAFDKYSPEKIYIETEKLTQLGNLVYESEKWTVKDIIQHVIDNERIMAYRALRFSRNDKTVLPGYEEAVLAANTTASTRTVLDLMQEFIQVRASTLLLFANMNDTMLLNAGVANQTEISPLSLAFVILGHPVHHMNIIRERYYPLIK